MEEKPPAFWIINRSGVYNYFCNGKNYQLPFNSPVPIYEANTKDWFKKQPGLEILAEKPKLAEPPVAPVEIEETEEVNPLAYVVIEEAGDNPTVKLGTGTVVTLGDLVKTLESQGRIKVLAKGPNVGTMVLDPGPKERRFATTDDLVAALESEPGLFLE